MKKFFIITSIILTIFLLTLVGYYFIIKSNSQVSEKIPVSIRNFLPFGGGDTVGEIPRPVITDENTQPEQNFTQKLRKISSNPVAGAGVFDSKLGTTVRYIEKATGHIYDAELFSARLERISNTTLPQVYDAIWGTSSSTFLATYLKNDNETVETYTLSLKQSTSTQEGVKYTVGGSLLQFNIKDISPYDNSILYTYISNAESIGVLTNYSGTNKKQVWKSPIREVIPQFVNTDTVTITTKPSENIAGFLYFVNIKTGEMRKILGGIRGLSTLTAPDAKHVLSLEQGPSGDTLSLVSVSDKSSQNITPITFTEKCVWSKKDVNIVYCAVPQETLVNVSLTNWYKGISSFTDQIWKYDLKNNISTNILDITKESGELVDVLRPQLSQNERYIVFTNKRDGSLWSFDLEK